MYEYDYRPYFSALQSSLDALRPVLDDISQNLVDIENILSNPLTFQNSVLYLMLGVIVLCLLLKR